MAVKAQRAVSQWSRRRPRKKRPPTRAARTVKGEGRIYRERFVRFAVREFQRGATPVEAFRRAAQDCAAHIPRGYTMPALFYAALQQ